jgi:hypothetical protein
MIRHNALFGTIEKKKTEGASSTVTVTFQLNPAEAE